MVSFNKSNTPPASLASHVSYTGADVISQLITDFKNKCYICGDKGPTSLNVEHFDEHRGDETKKYDWNNLFYACAHCNSVKQYTFTTGSSNLLNCTDRTHKVDYWIEYRLKLDEKLRKKAEIKKNATAVDAAHNTQVNNTVRLLDRVYNGSGTALKDTEAENLLNKVNEEILKFRQRVLAYKTERNPGRRTILREELKSMLSYEAPFAAFKRWIVRDLNILDIPMPNATDAPITPIALISHR